MISVPGFGTDPRPVLGVDRSVTAKRWRWREPVVALDEASLDRLALAIAQRHGVPELLGRLLARRGIALDEVPRHLAPRLRDSLPDPSSLKDAERAAERLARAVMAGERIALFADYDVDGATSAALMCRFLTAAGAPPLTYIPDRITEGYGPNAAAFDRLAAQGARLVVTLDCGTTAHAALAHAAAIGLEVIVCDHHLSEVSLPPAHAVVNPNRFDETTPHRQLAAVGVSFLLAIAANRVLRREGWWREERPEPDLLGLVDLAALGTVADVVPLTGLNRALVATGLKVIEARRNPGLAALMRVARLQSSATAYHLGYVLGPRVNAGGRIGAADLGFRLLAGDTGDAVEALAARLEELNAERRAIEAAVLDDAMAMAERQANQLVILVAAPGWHPGVIGIVAARLKERFHRPALVASVAGDLAKGSGRSIPGAALGPAILAAREAGLIEAGGGHAMAAGFTARIGQLGRLAEFLAERFATALTPDELAPTLGIDAVIDCAGATPDLIDALDALAPFGTGNPEPRFALANVRIDAARPLNGGHFRCRLAGESGAKLATVAFRVEDPALATALADRAGTRWCAAGHLRRDRWNGANQVQLVLEDLARIA